MYKCPECDQYTVDILEGTHEDRGDGIFGHFWCQNEECSFHAHGYDYEFERF